MSNDTIASRLRRSRRAVQIARRRLENKLIIYSHHNNPRTVRSWARYHPAVRCADQLFVGQGQQIDNPFYDEWFAKEHKKKRKKKCH